MESVRGVVRRAVNILSKQHQMGPKALAVNPQTSYGPEGRGFESLRAYHDKLTDYTNGVVCQLFYIEHTKPVLST